MAKENIEQKEEISRAIARGSNLSISFKHCVNIGRVIRGRDVTFSVRFITDVINGKRVVPTKRYGRDTAHKPGTAGGRFHSKALVEVIRILNSAIANAKNNHMDIERLYIYKFESNREISKNKTSKRGIGRLTNVTIELRERPETEKKSKKPKVEKPSKPAKTASPTAKTASPTAKTAEKQVKKAKEPVKKKEKKKETKKKEEKK
jgi:large subunit ribosomal protein L22